MPDNTIANHYEDSMKKVAQFRKDSQFFLNTTDVVLIVEDEKLPANRFILAVYSEVLANLLYGDFKEAKEPEVTIKAPKIAFKMLLDYFYSGYLDLKNFDVADLVDLLELSRRYNIDNLEEVLVSYLCAMVQPKDVSKVLEMALLLEIDELEESCWPIIEMIVEGIFECELELSETTITKFLDREPRRVSEIKLFQFLHRTLPDGLDESMISSIDFTLMTVKQIIETVRPTKVLSDSRLFDVIQENSTYASVQLLEHHFPSLKETFKVSCESSENLFRTDDKFASCEVSKGILIDLGSIYVINHIQFKFRSGGYFAKYYVQVSRDKESWETIVDYLKSYCFRDQKLYFPEIIAKYIKIVGSCCSSNTKNSSTFECNSFKVCYLEQPIKSLAGYHCASQNVALNENAIMNIDGKKVPCEAILSGNFLEENIQTPYVSHDLKERSIKIFFHQPCILNSCRLRLWDYDGRKQSFKIISSLNNDNFEDIYHKSDALLEGWQTINFSPRFVYCFEIIGLQSSIEHDFRLAYFEAPAPNNQ